MTSTLSTLGSSAHVDALEYEADTDLFSVGWSYRKDLGPRLAVGTFVEQYNNTVHVIQHRADNLEFIAVFDHPYPTTKVSWIPDTDGTRPDLIGTTGDMLRLWEMNEDTGKPVLKALLNSDKQSKFCAPLTAFDWNEADPTLIGTSSIDTTCTIWNIETEQVKTQLIAHDKDVYDFAFAASAVDNFASVGADGSVRLFDLRNLDHSTIIYESPDMTPLLRLRWNTCDPTKLATIAMDSSEVIILDIRKPSIPFAKLDHKTGDSLNCVNAISWAPHDNQIATGSDRCLALIWNTSNIQKFNTDPFTSYAAGASISNLQWSPVNNDLIAIVLENKLRVLRT